MNDLTILSIMRNSLGYLARYQAQVNAAFAHFERPHLILCEGDSDDGTKAALEQLEVAGDFTLLELNTGGPLWPSISHPSRWRQLELAWNTCLSGLEPTEIAVCVESDLIWDWPTAVACPLLLRQTPATGLYFYDTNAFCTDGQHFRNAWPYHPALGGGERFIALETGGGMLVTTDAWLRRARWEDACVLHFPLDASIRLDSSLAIYHP
jgi:hypothetical protein